MPPMLGLRKPDAARVRASLQASAYIDVSRVKVPSVVDWSARTKYGNYDNDKFGNCGPTGCANLIRQWSSNVGQPIVLPQGAVDKAYADVGGWNGLDSGRGTDQGVDPLALLDYFRKTGIGGRKIKAYVLIDHNDTALVDACLYLFGGLAIGFNMPAAWQETIGDVWRGPRNAFDKRGQWADGSWGGHFVVGAKANELDWEVATWGTTQKVSGTGFKAYCMFLAAVISDDWFDGVNKRAPNGFDADLLTRDLDHIANGKPLEERPSEQNKPTNTWRDAANAVTTILGGKVERVSDSEDRVRWQ
jgi:hypothetical protein